LPIRLAVHLAAMLLAAGWPAVAIAGPTTPTAHKVSMHPSALTLKGHTRANAKGQRRHHNYVHDTFHQPTHVHGTMAGPRM
jgi:hypothetical protein